MRLEMAALASYRYLRAKHPSSHANSTHLGVPEVLLYGAGCISCSDKGWAPVEVTTSESFRHLPGLCLGQVGSSCGLSGGGNLVKCVGLCMEERVCVFGKAAAQYGAGVVGSRKSAWLWSPGTDLEVRQAVSCPVLLVIPPLCGVCICSCTAGRTLS